MDVTEIEDGVLIRILEAIQERIDDGEADLDEDPFDSTNMEMLDNVCEYFGMVLDDFVQGLEKTPFKFQPASGSFFQWVSYAHLSDISDFVLATRMTKELKVACIPFSVFYSDQRDLKRLRFCFAKEKQELDLAVDRLCRIHEILV